VGEGSLSLPFVGAVSNRDRLPLLPRAQRLPIICARNERQPQHPASVEQ
jgi:hypothetical protein